VSTIRALVALENGVAADTVRSALPSGGIEVLQWFDAASAQQAAKQTNADLVIVACSGLSGSSISLLERVSRLAPGQPVVVLQLDGADANGFMQQVFAAGADDIVALPEAPERIRHALQKAIARKRGATLAEGAVPASLICVLGPKGGTGKTVTACNLAVALAERTSICTSVTWGSASASRPNARSTISPRRAGPSTPGRSATTSPTISRE
jgi:pilus assembly protein CpaE